MRVGEHPLPTAHIAFFLLPPAQGKEAGDSKRRLQEKDSHLVIRKQVSQSLKSGTTGQFCGVNW